MFQVVGGDFGDSGGGAIRTTLLGKPEAIIISTGILKNKTIPVSHVSSCQLVTDENKVSLLGAAAGGAIGTLLAGPIGLFAGSILGGKKTAATLLVTLRDGKQFLAVASGSDTTTLLGLGLTGEAAQRKAHEQEARRQARRRPQTDQTSAEEDEAFGYLSD